MLDALPGSPPVDLSCPTLTSSTVASSGVPDCLASRDFGGYPVPVPRWCLAQEGPFLSDLFSPNVLWLLVFGI